MRTSAALFYAGLLSAVVLSPSAAFAWPYPYSIPLPVSEHLSGPAPECAHLLGTSSVSLSSSERASIAELFRATQASIGAQPEQVVGDALEETNAPYGRFLNLLSRARRSADPKERRDLEYAARALFMENRANWGADWSSVAPALSGYKLSLDERGLPAGLEISVNAEGRSDLSSLRQQLPNLLSGWRLPALRVRIQPESLQHASDATVSARLRDLFEGILAVPSPIERLEIIVPTDQISSLRADLYRGALRSFLTELYAKPAFANLAHFALRMNGMAASAQTLREIGKIKTLRSLAIHDRRAQATFYPAKTLRELVELEQITLDLQYPRTRTEDRATYLLNIQGWEVWIGSRPKLWALDYSPPFSHLEHLPYHPGLKRLALRRSTYLLPTVENLLSRLPTLTHLEIESAALEDANRIENGSSTALQRLVHAIGRLRRLEFLNLQYTIADHDTPLDLSSWRGLQHLSQINVNAVVSTAEIRQLSQLPGIRTLELPYFQSRDLIPALQEFPTLEELILAFEGAYDPNSPMWTQIKSLPHIRVVQVRSALSEDQLKKIRALLLGIVVTELE